jgi:hypothetical protein
MEVHVVVIAVLLEMMPDIINFWWVAPTLRNSTSEIAGSLVGWVKPPLL